MTSENSPNTEHHPMPRSDKFIGRLYALGTAFLWSSSGLFIKSPFFDDWSVLDRGPMLAFWRVLFAGLVMLPFARNIRWRPTLAPLAVSFSAMNILYPTAMVLTTAANAIWIQSIAPWWTLLFAIFLFHEAFHRRDLIPLCFGGLGVGFIIYFEMTHSDSQSITGAFCALTSGVAYAGVCVCMRHLRHENAAWLIAYAHLIGALVLLPWILYRGLMPSPLQLLILAAFGIIQMALPYLLLTKALKRIGSVEAISIGLLEPVMLPIWVFLAWGEVPAWWTIAGAICILSGLCVRYFVFKSE